MRMRRGKWSPWALVLMASMAAVGCQEPTALEVKPPAVQAVGGMETWPSTQVELVPVTEADREVLAQGQMPRARAVSAETWFSGDRHRPGVVSPYWGNVPLGYGYYGEGALPFIAGDLGGYGSALYYYDPARATVYQEPALDDVGILAAGISGGGRFVSFVDYGGSLGIYDTQTKLIQTFPQLDYYNYGYGLGRGFGRGYGLLAFGAPRAVGGWYGRGYGRGFDVDAFGDLTYIDPNGRLRVFDPRTNQEFIVAGATRGLAYVNDVSFSPDGRFVTIAGNDGSGDRLFVTDLAGGRQMQMPFIGDAYRGPITSASVNPATNQVLFTEDGRTRLLDLRTGFIDNLALLNSPYDYNYDADFLDPLGENIAYVRNGQLQVYNRATNLIDTMPIANRDAALMGGFAYRSLW